MVKGNRLRVMKVMVLNRDHVRGRNQVRLKRHMEGRMVHLEHALR